MNINTILDLFFPRYCLDCGTPGSYLCTECFKKISIAKSQCCPNCRIKNNFGNFCNKKCAEGFYFDQLITCLSYEKTGLIKKLIVQFKYKFSEELAGVLAKVMTHQFAYFSHCFRENIVIVPVPINKKRLNYRGFNQSFLLAKYIEKNSGGRIEVLDCLMRKPDSLQQAKLSRDDRLTNLKDAIFCKNSHENSLRNKTVILIDDIATTCSTLNACAKVLKEAGAKYVCGLVLARGKLFAKQ